MIILENGKIGKKNNREKVKFWYCSRVGTFGIESAVRKRDGSRILSYTLTLDVPRRTDYTRAYEKFD